MDEEEKLAETRKRLMELLDSGETRIVRPLLKLKKSPQNSRSASGLTMCMCGDDSVKSSCKMHDFYETKLQKFLNDNWIESAASQ